MESTTRRIYRSNDRIIAGVVGGFAERYDLEPTILRLAVVFMTVITGLVPGIITYLVAMAIMPAHTASERTEEPARNVDQTVHS